jgi:hypothetical protein
MCLAGEADFDFELWKGLSKFIALHASSGEIEKIPPTNYNRPFSEGGREKQSRNDNCGPHRVSPCRRPPGSDNSEKQGIRRGSCFPLNGGIKSQRGWGGMARFGGIDFFYH